MNFDVLPPEIKSYILSYLSFDDLHFKVSNVSKQWRTSSRDPHVVKHIEIDQRFNPKEITQCLVNYKLARNLTLRNVVEFDWVNDIPKLNNLRRLHFDSCNFQPSTLTFLCTRFPSVSKIKMTQCRYLISTISTVGDLDFFNITNDILQMFAKNCYRLEDIEIDDYNELDETSFQLLLHLHGSSLRKLSLSRFELTDKNFDALSQCPQITDLKLLSMWYLKDLHFLSIQKLTSLRSLWIENAHKVSENAFATFFKHPVFPHLQSIKLNGCGNLSDNILRLISECYPCLKSLDVSDCYNVTDTGIFSVTQNCRNLEILNIAYNCNVTGRIISPLISNLRRLKCLNICNCTQLLRDNFYRMKLINLFPGLHVIYTKNSTVI